MTLPDSLRELLSAQGPSGYEDAPAAVWRRQAEAFAEVETDTTGSTTAVVKGKGEGPTLAIVGHIDEIGLIVTHIDDKGFLYFSGFGWDAQILVGQRVAVATRGGTVLGVIGRKPIHLLSGDERKKVSELKELHIDIGCKDGDEARERVRVGDTAVIAADPIDMPGGRVVARALDNRRGCFVALEVARQVAEAGGAAGDVVAVAAAQEETTFAGAKAVTWRVEPDVAVVVDVTHATDAPGIDEREHGAHALGSGPVIARGQSLHPKVFELLADSAESESIAYTLEASDRWSYTDADAVTLSRAGVPCGLVQLPLRYMHSPVEMVQLSDVEDAIKLITAFALALEPAATFNR
jgi:endoglucanase